MGLRRVGKGLGGLRRIPEGQEGSGRVKKGLNRPVGSAIICKGQGGSGRVWEGPVQSDKVRLGLGGSWRVHTEPGVSGRVWEDLRGLGGSGMVLKDPDSPRGSRRVQEGSGGSMRVELSGSVQEGPET